MPSLHLLFALILVVIAAIIINRYVPMAQRVRLMLNVVLTLIVVGGFLWLVNNFVPMAASIRGILNIVVVVAICVWVLKVFGIWPAIVRLCDDLMHRQRIHTDPPTKPE